MNAATLRTRLADADAPLLVNVLTEDAFNARHIEGSVNACVYEVSFIDKMAGLAPSKDQEIVVYGAGGASRDAETAAAKLAAGGWMSVTAFEDGLAGWEAAGLPLETSPAEAPVLDGAYALDTAASELHWTGRNPFNQHRGTVGLGGGSIVFKDGDLVSARIVIDMRAITCADLEGSEYHDVLIHHLHSDDFFDVANHPEAVFVADGLAPEQPARPGHPCYGYTLHGHFTLRGVTRPMSVPITMGSADGVRVTGQAALAFDRTDHGAHYGSNRLFAFLGKHVVDDTVHLNLKLTATK